MPTEMVALPIGIADANKYVAAFHRHSKPTSGGKFAVGCVFEGRLVGVAICSRPVARMLDRGGRVIEVTRLCTTGHKNVCSFLYSRCARIAREMGYERIVTYIRDDEIGVSLRASGWVIEADVSAKSWDTPKRRRNNTWEVVPRTRWGKVLNDSLPDSIEYPKEICPQESLDLFVEDVHNAY